jgi:hypothetical protein
VIEKKVRKLSALALKEKIEIQTADSVRRDQPPQSCDGDVIREKARYFKGLWMRSTSPTIRRPTPGFRASRRQILLDEGVERHADDLP